MTFNEAAAVSQPYHLFRISHPENFPWFPNAAFLDQMAHNARKKRPPPSVSPENVGNFGTSGRHQFNRMTECNDYWRLLFLVEHVPAAGRAARH